MLIRSNLLVAAVLTGMFCVASAQAVQVDFSFQVNSVADQPLFTYDNQGTSDFSDDTFAVTAGTTAVDLSVQVEGGLDAEFNDAKFTLDSTVDSISYDSSVGRFVFNLIGNFAFTTEDDNEIVSGSFTMGKLNLRAVDMGGGNFGLVAGESFFDFSTDGMLYTSSGPALTALTAGQVPGGFQTMHFTVTGLQEANPFADAGSAITVSEEVPGQVYNVLDSFAFNSSYSGTSELVPEPASVGLCILGALVLARRRKG